MNEPLISNNERIEEGQLLVRTIIEMLGAPKDHVGKTLKEYINSIRGAKGIDIVKEYYAEPEEVPEKKLFSTYAELEIWFKDTEKLISFCFDSLPSSIEILEPEEVRILSNKFSGLLNDLQAKLHKLDSVLKRYITDQKAGAESFRGVVDNFMAYCIRTGKDTPGDISKVVGVDEERVEKWLNEMCSKKLISKNGNRYVA